MAQAKKYKDASARYDKQALLEPTEAFELVKSMANKKFDETVEAAFRLGVDPRKADQMLRGTVSLPAGTGKDVRVAVFAAGDAAEAAREAGADVVGAEDLVEQVQKGVIDFDRCIATPDMMPLVGRLGKVLGPRGLMPNPKVGTVTADVAAAVKNAKAGQVQFRANKEGIVHCSVGRASFTADNLQTNIAALVDALNKSKPTSVKGIYLKKVSVSSTMGIGVRVDTATLSA